MINFFILNDKNKNIDKIEKSATDLKTQLEEEKEKKENELNEKDGKNEN